MGVPDRRQFLEAMATLGAMTTFSGSVNATTGSPAPRWPKLTGSPVLDSLHPVIEHSRDVHTHMDRIVEVARWMAYEELPMPDYQMPFDMGKGTPTSDRFRADRRLRGYSLHRFFHAREISGGLRRAALVRFRCALRLHERGDGQRNSVSMASSSHEYPARLERIFAGDFELPMLE